MRREVLIILLVVATAIPSFCQVQMPTADLYDTESMNMYLRALAETEAKRKEIFYEYTDMAFSYARLENWPRVLECSQKALDMQFYTAELYCLRGIAFEHLSDYKNAKKEYKRAYKAGYNKAKDFLNALDSRKK